MSDNLVQLNPNSYHSLHRHSDVCEELRAFCKERKIDICSMIKYPDSSTGYFISENLRYLEANGMASSLSHYMNETFRSHT